MLVKIKSDTGSEAQKQEQLTVLVVLQECNFQRIHTHIQLTSCVGRRLPVVMCRIATKCTTLLTVNMFA